MGPLKVSHNPNKGFHIEKFFVAEKVGADGLWVCIVLLTKVENKSATEK